MKNWYFRARVLKAILTCVIVTASVPELNADVVLGRLKARTDARVQAALTAMSRNDLKRAERVFLDIIKADPEHIAARAGLADIALRTGDRSAAETHLKQALAVAPDDAQVNALWGRHLYLGKDMAGAETALRRASGLEPQGIAVRLQLGDLYLMGLKKPQSAIEQYQAVLKVAPDHAGAHYALGLAYLGTNSPKQAEQELLKAVKLAPTNPLPPHALGRMYAVQNRADKALEAFGAAIKAFPQFSAAYMDRGNILMSRGSDDAALKEYDAALKFNPKLVLALVRSGMIHERHQRWQEAETAYRAAVAADSKAAVAYNNLAGIAAVRKTQLEQAVTWAKKAIALQPNVPQFHGTLGWVYRAQGDLTRAAEALQKAARLKTVQPETIYRLAVVRAEQGRTSESLAALKRALSQKGDFPSREDARRRVRQLERS